MATHHVKPACAAVDGAAKRGPLASAAVDGAAKRSALASAAVDGAAEKSADVSWGLLESFAWMGKVENATTAVSKTSDNKHIQITFCPRAPPHLSRFYIHSPDGAAADMYMDPLIVATDDDIALLRVDNMTSLYPDYYLYQADDGSGKPSLTLLPKTPDIRFHDKDIGLLRRPGKEYIIAGFKFLHEAFPPRGLTLCVYDSKRADWKLHSMSLSVQGRQEYGDNIFVHKNCKVLAIGGDAGTMAFVDLWRGVLFCDILRLELEAARQAESKAIPLLDYVPLPDDLRRAAKLKGDARLHRDIAFLNNHLKCVDLASRSLWIRPATTSGAWSQEYMIRSFKEIASRNPRINILPGHNKVYRSFAGLSVCQPVMGLQDDDAHILYFTVKTEQTEQTDVKGAMLALDLSTKKILGVAPFTARHKYDFTYVPTRLFKHLSGAKASLNQSGMVLQRSASKMKDEIFKHLSGGNATLNQSGMVLQESTSKMKDKAQKQLDGESVAEDGDAMALD